MTDSEIGLAWQTDKPPGRYGELAAAAESFGFDVVSVFADLLYQPPLPALLEMASSTSRVRLGAACLNPFTQHPYEIAGGLAVLDTIAPGRTYLGLARGAWLDALGLSPRRPLDALRDTAAIVRALLAGDSRGYDGAVYRLAPGVRLRGVAGASGAAGSSGAAGFSGAAGSSGAAGFSGAAGASGAGGRRPPLLLLGAWGPRGAALAGEIADEIKVGGSANPAVAALVTERVRASAVARGRPAGAVRVVLGAVTVVDRDGAAARRRARTEVAKYLAVVASLDETVALPPGLVSQVRELVAAGSDDAAGLLIPDWVLDLFAFSGTPGHVAALARRVLDAGAGRVDFGGPHGLSDIGGLELLGREVLPLLRR